MSTPLPAAIEAALVSQSVQAVLDATIAHFGCAAGTVHFLRDGMLQLAASKNIPPPVLQIVATVPIGKGIAGLAAQQRAPVTICNLQTDDSGKARPGAKGTGMEGSIAVPMLTANDLRGVLGIAKAEACEWPGEDSALLLTIASRLGELRP
jgi:signal transduction protein with GAF and PtsI domain